MTSGGGSATTGAPERLPVVRKASVTSLAKMLKILDLFDDARTGIALEDAVAATGGSRATVYRYLKALAQAGLVAPASGGMFVLGSRIIELDRLMRLSDPLAKSARPVMQDVSGRLGLNMMLCSYFGDNVMCAEIVWPDRTVAQAYERGRRMPMFRGAMAKLILANLTPYQLKNMMLWHADEIRAAGLGESWPQFRQAMARIRRQGHCVTRGEVVEGLVGIGAPVFDPDGRVLGSIVFAMSEREVARRGEETMRDEIVAAARAIGQAIAARGIEGGEPAARPVRPRKAQPRS